MRIISREKIFEILAEILREESTVLEKERDNILNKVKKYFKERILLCCYQSSYEVYLFINFIIKDVKMKKTKISCKIDKLITKIKLGNTWHFYPFETPFESFYFNHRLKELLKKVNYGDAKVVIDKNKMNNINLMGGVGEKEKTVFFSGGRESSSSISNERNQKIETTIDSLNEKMDLIKMDIEGYAYKAILGAEKTIKKYKPVLSISLYHSPKDFFEIPKLLKQWVSEYKMRFLDLNPMSPLGEKVLLAYIE